jgi:hypothetical protein
MPSRCTAVGGGAESNLRCFPVLGHPITLSGYCEGKVALHQAERVKRFSATGPFKFQMVQQQRFRIELGRRTNLATLWRRGGPGKGNSQFLSFP